MQASIKTFTGGRESQVQQATKMAATDGILRRGGSVASSRCWCSPVPCSWETGGTSKLPVGCWVGLIRTTFAKIMFMFIDWNKALNSATELSCYVSEWKLRAALNVKHEPRISSMPQLSGIYRSKHDNQSILNYITWHLQGSTVGILLTMFVHSYT